MMPPAGTLVDERYERSMMSTTSTDQHDSHGSSPAAWTAVIIMLVAFSIGTFAFWFDVAWLVWASAGLLVVGAIVGGLLAKAGYGVGGEKLRAKVHS
jgi:hypothetical protein